MSVPTNSPCAIAWPPLVVLGTFGPGLLLHWLMPVPLPPPMPSIVLGALFCVTGGAVGAWGIAALRHAGTNVRPDHPTTVLVTDGPFRFSRNPLYLALTALCLGITLMLDALWPLLTLFPMVAILHWGIIPREEHYLEAKFGDAYRSYKARVRRWI